MESSEQDEGEGGLGKKVAAGVAVGLATTAAAGVAKKLLDRKGDDGGEVREGAENRARSSAGTAGEAAGKGASAAKSTRGGAARQARSTGSGKRSSRSASSAGSNSPTKEQLYAQAKRLKITGRSSMSKDQLQRAVQRAKK